MARRTVRSARLTTLVLTPIWILACGGDSTTDPGEGPGGEEPPPPPAAPSGLTATAESRSRIALTWQDNSTNESGFQVERSPNGSGSWSEVGATGVNVTTFEDGGLEEDTERFYRVVAVGTGGTSGFSNVASARTLSGTFAVATEIEDVIEGALPPPGTPLAQRNLLAEIHAVADAVRGMDGVDTVLVLERVLTTQIVYDDGIVHLFINNRPEEIEEQGGSPAAAAPLAISRAPWASPTAAARFPSGVPAASDGPPGTNRAVVTSFDGGAGLASEVAAMVSEAGYQVLGLGASLGAMRQYKNLGLLYIDTHGVSYNRAQTNDDGTVDLNGTSYALQTSTVLGTDLSALRPELLRGALAITTITDAGGRVRTKIAITEVFIAENWSFEDGVAVLHACFSGAAPFTVGENDGPILDPAVLRLTTLGAGARLVVGFDHLTWATYARPSVRHFFDRMLGADEVARQSPPLRPFDMNEVYDDMQERGLLRFQRPQETFLGFGWGGNEVNVVFDRLPGRATLAPSIRTMDIVDDVTEGAGLLTLDGLFGEHFGSVEVAGAQIPVESWSADRIVARAPFVAGGSAGPVVVKNAGGVKSNEVPLTEWRGTVTFEVEVLGSLKATTTIDLRFRGDVHAFRERLTDDARHREVPTYFSPASTGTLTGSGTHMGDNSVTTWYGNQPMTMLPKGNVDSGFYPLTGSVIGGRVRLDPDRGTAEICLGIWGNVQTRTVSSEGTFEGTVAVAFIYPPMMDRMHGLFGCVDADLDDDSFVIDGDRRTDSQEDLEFTLEWSDFTPFAAPRDDTAG